MDLINENLIQINVMLKDKNEVINELAEMLYNDERTCNKEGLIQDILKREEEFSTSMGLGVAIPHAHTEHVNKPSLIFIKLSEAISWGNDDNVELIFGIANPSTNISNDHLKILAELARKLMDDEFRGKLVSIEDKKEALKIVSFLNNCI
ncbi:PTS sugar transporter subunit IIA [Paratissierella segnis]|jgi:fructose-specific phosphotransferase system IIA component|uniref:PTS sugar transporter subunit IIA n=1 Tax=Paratissierella segnis TaxID=2763679 RepID=A0A926IJC9_9FIRM|nr:PTS sugar transporter subunit IIA [Paratissierella segnis]MBC8587296.1 PTS sugar transporter subunit IIA [Paratissierella segnis]